MNVVLTRTESGPDGIFGTISVTGHVFSTLEHAYEQDGAWLPKLPAGSYKAVLGHHMLHSGPVETYEVQDVPGHSGILCCHVGNLAKDSEGCVLIGLGRDGNAITHSRDAFNDFLALLGGAPEYDLEVVNV